MQHEEKLVEKISALLAKAEATSSQAEADAFNAKAEELMIKYGIEQAMISASSINRVEQIIETRIEFRGAYHHSDLMLGHKTAQALFNGSVHTLQQRLRSSANAANLMLIGYESDVRQCEVLIASLLMQAHSQMKRWWDLFRYDNPDFTKNELIRMNARRSFIDGFAEGAATRIKEMYTETVAAATTENPGTEVALVDRKRQVQRFVHTEYNVGRARSRRVNNSQHGRAAGTSAGRNANVGGHSISASRPAIGR